MPRLLKTQHTEIIGRYKNGELCSDLAREFGVDRSSVDSLLRRNNVQMHGKSYVFRKASGHFLDESAFDVITENSAYWIGFLLADGAIVDNTVALCLQSRDSYHLDKFRQFVGGSQSLTEIKSTNAVRYAFQSREIVNRLAYFGVTSCKSHTAKVSESLQDNKHFWRGVVDGDGSLGVYKNHAKTTVRFELLGSSMVIDSFVRFAKCCFDMEIKRSEQRGISRVQVGGKPAAKVINGLYTDASISLDRKALSAYEVWQWSGS